MAHLTSFVGTDTIPAVDGMEYYYGGNADKELVGCSVSATEHSVMCAGGEDDEIETFERLITEIYPTGIISIVSDTWDFWSVVGGKDSILYKLRDKIMERDGTVVIRPDSGDPVHIICGYTEQDKQQMPLSQWNKLTEFEKKGLVECLLDIFGGKTNKKGYITLDSHIGAIYGDSITIERASEILYRLEEKGFASSNIVFGVGSFSYQGAVSPDCIVTRDTHAMAIKATYVEVNGEGRNIFKNPKTDDGTKKSAKGLIAVYKDPDGQLFAMDESSFEDIMDCEFSELWTDGSFKHKNTLGFVRNNIRQY